jgi:hypothetical protein
MLDRFVQGQQIMGITVEEYLKERQACSHCEDSNNEEYCVTHMLSRPDNCMIYNSVNYNSYMKNSTDMALLTNLRATPGGEKTVLEYYLRSEPIVKQIKNIHRESIEIWDMYYEKYVYDIIKSLQNGNVTQAQEQIFSMLDELESIQKN